MESVNTEMYFTYKRPNLPETSLFSQRAISAKTNKANSRNLLRTILAILFLKTK